MEKKRKWGIAGEIVVASRWQAPSTGVDNTSPRCHLPCKFVRHFAPLTGADNTLPLCHLQATEREGRGWGYCKIFLLLTDEVHQLMNYPKTCYLIDVLLRF